MQHYRDVVQDRSGNVIGGAIVTVIDHSSGQSAPLYSDANGSIPLTSVITDTNGTFSFYVASGRYDITVSKNGIVLSSVSDVFITVTADYPTAMDSATAQAGTSTTAQTVSASVLQSAYKLSGQNTILGESSFLSNLSSTYNSAYGYQSLQNVTSGGLNTGMGAYSLRSLTTGTNNVAIGRSAGLSIISGIRNTALGDSALNGPTGSYNLGLGATSLQNLTTGSGNISIGGYTAAGAYSPANDISGASNNLISIGSTSVTNAYIQVGWTTVSDARDKTNFNLIPHGLDFVTKLNPVSYQFKETRESSDPYGKVRYGFKAQEILTLEGENSVIIDADDADKLRYNSDYLIPILVNAIQELTAKVILLEAKLK